MTIRLHKINRIREQLAARTYPVDAALERAIERLALDLETYRDDGNGRILPPTLVRVRDGNLEDVCDKEKLVAGLRILNPGEWVAPEAWSAIMAASVEVHDHV